MRPSTHNSPASQDSFFRYFKARFQPFRRPLFWGALGILSLLAVAIWQYIEHPEWLGGEIEQPETTLEPQTDPTPAPVAVPPLVPGTENNSQTPGATPGDAPLPTPQEPGNLLDRLIPKPNNAQVNPTEPQNSLFPSLVPKQSSTPNQAEDSPPASREDLLNRTSIDNRSFNDAANSQASPSNLTSEQSTSSSTNNSSNSEQAPTNTSPLERAVDRVMSPNSGSTPSSGGSSAGTGFDSSIDTSGYVPEAYGTTPTVPSPNYGGEGNDQSSRGAAQSDYDRSVPRDYGQLSPSGTAGADDYGQGASTGTTPPGQLNNYEFNNSFSPLPQSYGQNNAPAGQPYQPNNTVNPNPDPQTPQVQEPIQTDQSTTFDESPLFPE